MPTLYGTHNASHATEAPEHEIKAGVLNPLHSPTPTTAHDPAIPAKEHNSNHNKIKTSKQTESPTATLLPKKNTTQTVDASVAKDNSSSTIHEPSKQNATFNSSLTFANPNISHANDPSFRKKQIEFWASFETLLALSKPDCESPKRLGRSNSQGFNPSDHLERPNLTEMSKESVGKMREAHKKLVDGIKGNHPQMVFTPGSRGLVSTAGGKYLPVFVISLRMLRRTGTTLPVEVFLGDHEEYEENICKEVLPSLNATCVILSDILESAPHEVEIAHYQFKIFAMMFSSFEEILFLDADAFPIHNPEQLFTSEVFQKHGFITWPDFWASSISTLYYSITTQSVPAMTERASSETGELLISKKTHQRSLLLAAYYNYYGPNYYYPLLSQGAPGEGDKETFLAAASVVNESFYAVSEWVKPIGTRKEDGGLAGSAMVQHDPIQDYNLTSHELWRVKNPSVAPPPRSFFVHAHFPKFNPATIFQQDGPTKDSDGKDRLVWTVDENTIKGFGVDLERRFWEEIRWTACKLEDKFKTWKDIKEICKNATTYWDNIYGKAKTRRARRMLLQSDV